MHTILHIGSGQAVELDQWLTSGAQSIVLIEPNPILAEQLRQKTKFQPQVTVVEVAVTTQLSRHQLHEYNLPGVSSLRAATGLKAIFPGLQEVNTYRVETRSPGQLLKEYGPLVGQQAALLIETNGEEQAILQALIESDQLKAFSHLELTVGVESLFEGAATKSDLLDMLQLYGYELTQENQLDPDWVKLQLQRNPLKDQIEQLQAELLEKEQQLEQALAAEKIALTNAEQAAQQEQAVLQTTRKEIDDIKAREQKAITALEESLAAKEQELKQSQNALQTHKMHAQAVQKKLDEQKKSTAQYHQQVEQLEQALADEKATLASAQQATKQEQAALQTAQQEIEDIKANEQKAITALEESLAAKEQELKQSQNALQTHKTHAQAVQKKLDEQEKRTAQYHEQVEQLEEALAAEKAALTSAEKAVQQEQAALQTARKELESVKASEQKVVTALEESLAVQEKELKQSQDAVQTHKTHAQAVQKKLDEQKKSTAQYHQQVEQLEQALADEKATLASAQQATKQEQAALQTAQQEIEDIKANEQKAVKALEESLAAKEKELKQSQDDLHEHKGWLANRKKQAQELEELLAQEKEKSQKLLAQHTQLMADQSQSKDLMSTLEARMEQLFSQQASQIQQATNALGKHVTQSFVHQRQHYQSVTGLHQYLENGEQPLAFGNWAIDTELAVHLVRAIEQNSYDLIIEFGSGTSTALMARAIFSTLAEQTVHSESEQLAYEASPSPKKTSRAAKSKTLSLNEYDLPRRILSFEQDKNHQQQTKALLTAQGLANLVELVLAPLVPTRLSQQSDNQILFYDCEKHLTRIASLFEKKQARILVLVDGPSSPKNNPLAREPALANLLQFLSAHHLDIVLDDSKREGEQQVAEHWRGLCEERGLSWQEKALDTEKGALWVTVSP